MSDHVPLPEVRASIRAMTPAQIDARMTELVRLANHGLEEAHRGSISAARRRELVAGAREAAELRSMAAALNGRLTTTPAAGLADDYRRSRQLDTTPEVRMAATSPVTSGESRRLAGLDGELRRALDRSLSAGYLSAERAERVAEVAVGVSDEESGGIGERAQRAAILRRLADPSYVRAYARWIMDPENARDVWDPAERAVWAAAQEVRAALQTSSAPLPVPLDPLFRISGDGVVDPNPIRTAARRETTITRDWSGLVTPGITAGIKAELSEVADRTPALERVTVRTHVVEATADISFEYESDLAGVVAQLELALADAHITADAALLATGAGGDNAPEGLIVGLTKSAFSGAYIVSATGEVITAASVYGTQNALPSRFSPGAAWYMGLATMNSIRQLNNGTAGVWSFPEIRDNPPTLLNRPVRETSGIDVSINPAATADNFVAVYGDLNRAMVIVDRLGASLEITPMLGSNRRPVLGRHYTLYRRFGSAVVVPNAARVLNVPTAA